MSQETQQLFFLILLMILQQDAIDFFIDSDIILHLRPTSTTISNTLHLANELVPVEPHEAVAEVSRIGNVERLVAVNHG